MDLHILKKRIIAYLDYKFLRLAPYIPDKLFLRIHFRLRVGYWPSFSHPKSYNEKIQVLKFESKKHPEYIKMVDKIEAKEYVASIIGDKYIIPTLGTWNSIEEIEWEKLPNQFVIKSTCDSGGVVVCKNKSKLNINEVKEKLLSSGRIDYSIISKEFPYKNIPHRFIAEEYIVDESGYELKDYKFFCFDGEPKFLFVATGRQNHDTRFDFYDLNFNHLPIKNGYPNSEIWPIKPKNYDKMLDIAAKLSKGHPHIRVDLYNVNGQIYFGELTFFHWSGTVPFEPQEWDYKFGEYIKL